MEEQKIMGGEKKMEDEYQVANSETNNDVDQINKAMNDLSQSAQRLVSFRLTGDYNVVKWGDCYVELLPIGHGQMRRVCGDQVENNTDGFVFKVTDEVRVRRFLILGTDGGTFYQREKELKMENIQSLIEIIHKGDAHVILKEIEEINRQNRNPKMKAMLFALALCAKYNGFDEEKLSVELEAEKKDYWIYLKCMHKAAMELMPKVCRIPTHLFEFVNNCKIISESTTIDKKSCGWGRQMRTAISKWYSSKTPQQLALFLTKYPNRCGWSHRDLFRLAHPTLQKAQNEGEDEFEEKKHIYRYAVKGDTLRKRVRRDGDFESKEIQDKLVKYDGTSEFESKSLDLIEAYLDIRNETNEEKVINAIRKHNLVREHIPNELLNNRKIWDELLKAKIPMTAMIRNLAKMTVVGCMDDETRVQHICEQLTNVDELKKARIHPLNVLIAKSIYEQGRGDKGHLKWKVNEKIVDAMEKAFFLSFINAPSTGKRYCLAIDISRSMCVSVSGSPLSCRTAATAMTLIHLHNEANVKCVGFCDSLQELSIQKDWSMQRVSEYMDSLAFGKTDCALPMIWAAENKEKFDVFVVYTDSETYFGDVHPFEAMKKYREVSGIHDARLIVMGMTATKFTIADPSDRGMLDIAGFDSAVPQIIHEFVNGNI